MVEWPTILRAARRPGALLLLGDEASFAQRRPVLAVSSIRGCVLALE